MDKPKLISFDIPDDAENVDLFALDKEMLEEYGREQKETLQEVKPVVSTKVKEDDDGPLLTEQQRAKLLKIKLLPKDISSKGITYPNNAKIYFNEYSTIEIEKISKQLINPDLAQIFKLIFEGISTEGMNKKDLTTYDFFFLALSRKDISLDEKREYFPICNMCGAKKSFVYGYNEIETKDLDEKLDLPLKESFNVIGANGEQKTLDLEFMPLTMERFFNIHEDGVEERKESFDIYQCSNMDPKELMKNEFEVVSIKNSKKLAKISQKLFHGFKTKKEVCGEALKEGEVSVICENVIEFEVDDDYSLIMPFLF